VIYNIPAHDPLPWTHLFFPRRAFDEVQEQDGWIFARKGTGYVSVWLPEGYQWTTRGVWAGSEVRSLKPRHAMLVAVGTRAGGRCPGARREHERTPSGASWQG